MPEEVCFARRTETLAPENKKHLLSKLVRRTLKASEATWPAGYTRIVLDIVTGAVTMSDFESNPM
jgi:hypothetical protein